jgi:hypothetical protein
MTTRYEVLPGSLPRLCFGVRYRIRARAVDLAGNSLAHDHEVADLLSSVFGLPRDAEGFTYLRFEPVGAPVVIIRDERAVKDPGSAVDRLVIRLLTPTSARMAKVLTSRLPTGISCHHAPASKWASAWGCLMMPRANLKAMRQPIN